jgi:hypothetical protein
VVPSDSFKVSHQPRELLLLSFAEVGLKVFDDGGDAFSGDVARPHELWVTARYTVGYEALDCGDVDPQLASYDISRDAGGPVMGYVDGGGHGWALLLTPVYRVSVGGIGGDLLVVKSSETPANTGLTED